MSKDHRPTADVRQVLVDIATHDDDGNLITDDMLSSGGARDHGPIRKQYTNPRPYIPAAESPVDARPKQNEWILGTVRFMWDEFGRPWWTTRGPQDLRRAGGWVKSQANRLRKPAAEKPGNAQSTGSVEPAVADEAEASLAPVIDIEGYRRSA